MIDLDQVPAPSERREPTWVRSGPMTEGALRSAAERARSVGDAFTRAA